MSLATRWLSDSSMWLFSSGDRTKFTIVLTFIFLPLVVSGSVWFLKYQRQMSSYHHSILNTIAADLAILNQRRTLAQTYATEYELMMEQVEDVSNIRIDWIESIESTLSSPGVVFSHFEFSEATPLQNVESDSFAMIDVFEHPLRLTFTVIHDGHLMKLLGELVQHTDGLTENRGCDVHRHIDGIQASCLFSFFQVLPRSEASQRAVLNQQGVVY